MGKCSSRAYPRLQALALPLPKDKQRKACPRRAIFINTHYGAVIPDYYIRKERAPSWGVHLIIYIKGLVAAGRYKINPRRRFCCITAVGRIKFAKFEATDSNVRKRPLRLAVQMAWVSFHRCKF